MDRKRVVYYDFARVFAIISISFNHAVNRTFDNYTDTQAEFLSLDHQTILIKTCVTVFSRLGVPIFLMLTGALILSKSFETKDDLKRFYTHNWLRILITTELWLAIYYWFYYYLCPETYLLDLTHDELIHRFIAAVYGVAQSRTRLKRLSSSSSSSSSNSLVHFRRHTKPHTESQTAVPACFWNIKYKSYWSRFGLFRQRRNEHTVINRQRSDF